METISRLRAVLTTALSPRGSIHGEQELFDELMLHKSRLLALFDVGPRSAQEQRELEQGKTVVRGKSLAVNNDFARQVLFLSQSLDCSERYAAEILQTTTAGNPNIDPISSIEASIAEFHQRRRYLVDCLRYILEGAELAGSPDAPPMYSRIGDYVAKQLIPGGTWRGVQMTLVTRILGEIERLEETVRKAAIAKQNAGSDTTAPSQQGSPTLGQDILNARLESLKYERRYLAHVLYLVARLGYISPTEVEKLVEWLSNHPHHPLTFYILTTFLTAFDPAAPESDIGQSRLTLATNQPLITWMTKKLGPSTHWQEPGLKATVLLKWTLLLTDARHFNSALEHQEGFKTEELESQVWNSVQGDAFSYLSLALIQLGRKRGASLPSSYANSLALSPEQEQLREPPASDFKPAVLASFEILVRSLITHASSELRKIKQRQEDLVLANARTDRSRMFRVSTPGTRYPSGSQEPERPAQASRNDIAMLFCFIGLLYSSLPPESALQFWGSDPRGGIQILTYLEYVESTAGKLPGFLQWAVWSTQTRDLDTSMALYDMLAGLAKGQHCSELAYNFMAKGGGEVVPGSMLPLSSTSANFNSEPAVSWSMIFALLESWASSSSNQQRASQQTSFARSGFGNSSSQPWQNQASASNQQAPQLSLGPKDVLFAQAFLRLLANVASHSVAVRIAISGHAQFRAIPTLVSLIPLGIPLELKGALFETLAAFCEPGAGIPGIEICKAVWTLMERLEVINVRPSGNILALPPVKGVEVELEEVETAYRLYPATIPFLQLLATLIHTPKRIRLKDRIADSEPINTAPESLGQPYRLPGIGPFVSFVVDNVFSKISNREYLRPSDRWQMNDLCLCFIERSLASYDLEGLVSSTSTGDNQIRAESIIPLLVHPGYELMKRILTNTPLQTTLLSYIVDGVEGFQKEFADEEPFYRSTIIRVLRVVLRVLEIQDIYLDILIPVLAEFDSAPYIGQVHSRSFFSKFDQTLSFGTQYAEALAAYMAYPAYPELVLLSVKLITVLSSSNVFTNLVTIVERSAESDRILAGFRRILESESSEDTDLAEDVTEDVTGAGAPDVDLAAGSFEQAIRLAALELLILNTDLSRPYPNIAHFFLFDGSKRTQDPHALGSSRTSMHVILDLLNAGVPRIGRNNTSQVDPLFVIMPSLAEKCYRVVYQLCVHPRTSDFTLRYLRTREDFFARHLAAIPSKVPFSPVSPNAEVAYTDGTRVTTAVSTLSSFLRLRSWVFDLVALDLHDTTNKGLTKETADLLDILFGNGNDDYHERPGWDDDILQPFRAVGQSFMRIIEFVESLNFDWSDALSVEPNELQFLAHLDLQTCVRTNPSGCEVVDKTALLSLLTSAKRELYSKGVIATQAHADQLQAETQYILASCALENNRREIQHATAVGYESWRRMLDMVLTKCFSRLPHERRENMLFDLLHVIPTTIQSSDISESTAILLAETVLSSISKLREDRRYQNIVQLAGSDGHSSSLPAERLYSLLRSLLNWILDNNRMELVRGNLYAALVNFLHLIHPNGKSTGQSTSSSDQNSMSMSLSASTMREDFLFNDSQSLISLNEHARSSGSTVEAGSLAVMKGSIERLVSTVSRDAIDGSEVWKTVAFMLLDSLIQLSRSERQPVVLNALIRQGVLSNFIRGVKESDSRLQAVLKPDPDDLNPLYVYEAKMSLFIRMSLSRAGAERLLEANLLSTLSNCDFLDARPETDQSFMDQNSFLPSAIQRYHQLFMPALQVVNGILATLGSKHSTATSQALEFLSSHRDTIIILLKTEEDFMPLAFLEEILLIITVCGTVLDLVPKSELVLPLWPDDFKVKITFHVKLSANSGFGAIHAVVLSLATRCLGTGRWAEHIRPQTDAEVLEANARASGYDSASKFDVRVRLKERLVRKAIIIYLGSASEFSESTLTLVISPIMSSQHPEERGMRFQTTIPTVGDVVEALLDLTQDLSETLKQITDLSVEISAKDNIAVDDVNHTYSGADSFFLRDLTIAQKRTLIGHELERTLFSVEGDLKILSGSAEMLLLLLWRHLVYYTENPTQPSTGNTKSSQQQQMRLSTAQAMRFMVTPEPEVFKEELGRRIGPVLGRLADLDWDLESSNDWRVSQGYIEVMSRRIRDSLGLLLEDDLGGSP